MWRPSVGRWLPPVVVLVTMVAAAGLAVCVDDGKALAATPTRATIEATQFTVGSLQDGEAFARCPSGKRALGGGVVQSGPAYGFSTSASGPLDATGVTSETRNGDVAKQWYAAVRNIRDVARFRVFAVCSAASNATIEATNFTVGPGQTGEDFVVCPGSKRALGGGLVQSGPATGISVRASGPLDSTGITLETSDGDKAKRWYAAVLNATSVPVRFKVFAICSNASNATIEATQFTVGPNAIGERFAVCRGGKRALGGGVVQSGPADGLLTEASGPLDATGVTSETRDGDIAKQWYAAANNTRRESSVRFRVFAICE